MADVVDAPVQVTAEQLGVQARYVFALCISFPGVCLHVLPLVTNTSARPFALDIVCRLAVTNLRDN